ncbi:MAG: hypothetical protein WBV95_01765, partial [Desulfobacterales bacterium]
DDHDYEIFLYDGSKIIQLTDNERNDRKPHINDSGQVVWEADTGNTEIFLATPNLTGFLHESLFDKVINRF